MTLLGVLVIGNHPKLFKKKEKSEKKSSDFSKIKILLGNSYARIKKMLKFSKIPIFPLLSKRIKKEVKKDHMQKLISINIIPLGK